jgi:hypothetical protein
VARVTTLALLRLIAEQKRRAAAYATAAQISGRGPSGSAISAGGGYTFAETITQLAGRTAGVVALRDGLYAACQPYANGVLGQDAYSLILSQYGSLLVRLVSASSAPDPGDKPAAASSSTPTAVRLRACWST